MTSQDVTARHCILVPVPAYHCTSMNVSAVSRDLTPTTAECRLTAVAVTHATPTSPASLLLIRRGVACVSWLAICGWLLPVCGWLLAIGRRLLLIVRRRRGRVHGLLVGVLRRGGPVRDTAIRLLDEGALECGDALVDLVDLGMCHDLAVAVKCEADVDRVDAIKLGRGREGGGRGQEKRVRAHLA